MSQSQSNARLFVCQLPCTVHHHHQKHHLNHTRRKQKVKLKPHYTEKPKASMIDTQQGTPKVSKHHASSRADADQARAEQTQNNQAQKTSAKDKLQKKNNAYLSSPPRDRDVGVHNTRRLPSEGGSSANEDDVCGKKRKKRIYKTNSYREMKSRARVLRPSLRRPGFEAQAIAALSPSVQSIHPSVHPPGRAAVLCRWVPGPSKQADRASKPTEQASRPSKQADRAGKLPQTANRRASRPTRE
jgi:hypothetical protein